MPTRPVVVRAAPTHTGVSRLGLPSASPACCDRPGMESSHLHPVMQRLVAHEVPNPGAGPDRADPAATARAAGRATHDYLRHGTTTLFAALEVATGKVTDACHPRHTHLEFLAFLKQVAKTYPRVKLHIVCDNTAPTNTRRCKPG